MSHLLRFAIIAAIAALPAIAVAGDTEIAQQIVQRLQQEKSEGSLKGFNIGLRVDDGVVWLDGHVANEDQHDIAIDIARRVEGVQRVIDGIRIETARQAEPVASEPAAVPSVPSRPAAPAQNGPVELKSESLETPEGADFYGRGEESGFAFGPQQQASMPASLPSGDYTGQSLLVNHDATPADTMRPIQPATEQPRLQRPGGSQTPLAMSAAGSNAFPQYRMANTGAPMMVAQGGGMAYAPQPYYPAAPVRAMPVRYDQPQMPGYAWPAYAAHPNYAALTYPKQYSPAAWPYIGPFYPYPQVPLGWRKVSMEWDKGWWTVDFKAR